MNPIKNKILFFLFFSILSFSVKSEVLKNNNEFSNDWEGIKEKDYILFLEELNTYSEDIRFLLEIEEQKRKAAEEARKTAEAERRKTELYVNIFNSAFPAFLVFMAALLTNLFSSWSQKRKLIMEKKLWVYEEIIKDSRILFRFVDYYMAILASILIKDKEKSFDIPVEVFREIEGEDYEKLLSAIECINSMKAKFIMSGDHEGYELVNEFFGIFISVRDEIIRGEYKINFSEYEKVVTKLKETEKSIYMCLKI